MLKNEIESYQKPVFFDHKGSLDDFIALMSILTLDKYCISGITYTPGFCKNNNALETTHSILDIFCHSNLPLAVCKEPLRNEYSYDRNILCISPDVFNNSEIQKPLNVPQTANEDAAGFTAEILLNTVSKTIVIATGPATNLVSTLEKYPEVADKIERILWVGGAFLCDGNVIAPDHDGSAEWNFFADPHAAEKLLSLGIPVTLFPLDTVTQYPLDNYLLYHLENNSKKRLSRIAYQLLKPAYEIHHDFCIGSVMPSVYLGMPNIFQLDSKSIKVEPRGTSMGNIYRSTMGNRIKQASCIDEEQFYDYLISCFGKF